MFTKVYKEEDLKLRGCSYNVASIYFHLKNKRDFFKNNDSIYDISSCISESMGISIRTVKRAISTLKELGLISTKKRGKVNYYSFPLLEEIENKDDKKPSKSSNDSLCYSDKEKVTESLKTTKNKTKSSDWVKDNYNRLNDIKTNLNSSLSVQRRIAETNLNELLNSQIGETYKEEIKSFVFS